MTAETKTAYEWDDDPRNGLRVVSWSDFGRNCPDDMNVATEITWDEFCRYRRGATIMTKPGRSMLDNHDVLREPGHGGAAAREAPPNDLLEES